MSKRASNELDGTEEIGSVGKAAKVEESASLSLPATSVPPSLPVPAVDPPKISGTPATVQSAWRSVCLLEVVSVEWIYMCPWARASQKSWSGSGFCISQRRIMTNAHVVKSAIDIRVRQHSNARRYAAKVVTYGPDVDLAVLEIEPLVADEFWGNVGVDEPVVLAECLPALQETVRAIGFPRGGKTICITEGVVSRIDSIELTPPADSTCVIQIDAAINPGNSGGPVFNSSGEVTGVAFCKDVRNESDNIGYVIPAQVVRAFLERRHSSPNGEYVLSPSVPYRWHKLENKSLRAAHRVPDHISGVLLTSAAPFASSALREGDVLTKIDGRRVSDDGQVTLRGDELIQHRYLLRGKRYNEPTVFTVFRDGVEVEAPPLVLKDLPPICMRWADVDYLPEYLILGALAFVPLAQPLGWYKQTCPTELQATIARWNRRWPGDRDSKVQLVVLLNVFAHELTFGYVRPWRVVTAYNGVALESLRHLREMWHATRAEVSAAIKKEGADSSADASQPGLAQTVRLTLEHDDDIVLDIAAAMDAEAQVLKTHAIAKPSFLKGDT